MPPPLPPSFRILPHTLLPHLFTLLTHAPAICEAILCHDQKTAISAGDEHSMELLDHPNVTSKYGRGRPNRATAQIGL